MNSIADMETLTVPGTINSLATIAHYVKQAANTANLNPQVTYKLRLAVDELATNIIIHGYQEAGLRGEIQLHAEIDESNLTLTIEDTGVLYNPIQKATLQPEYFNQKLETREIGGLGVYLVLESVDEFYYQQIGDRNRNVLIVRR